MANLWTREGLITIIGVLLFLLLVSCGGKKLITIHKEDLTMLPIIETPGGFQVSKQKEAFDGAIVDMPILDFIDCYNASQISPFPLDLLRTYRFFLLERPWRCTFHREGCIGEFNRSQRSIWIAYYFADKGMTEHELAHMSNLINTYDNFLTEAAKESRYCFKMDI